MSKITTNSISFKQTTVFVGSSRRIGVEMSMSDVVCVFFSSRRRHTRFDCDWSSDVCSSDLFVSDVLQIQVELKFPRLQYIAYEPVVANLTITNLAGRDVDLRDARAQAWFGFEEIGRASCRERV